MLKSARREARLSQDELAQRAGVSRTTVARMETLAKGDMSVSALVRLLEAEKSERERELDNKRESNEGHETPHTDPARFFEYQRNKQREAELLRTVPPGLKPYYKARVAEYFDTFDRPR